MSHHIITARLQMQQAKVTVIEVYAPTETSEDSDKDEFYSQLQDTRDKIPNYDMKLLIGDFNAQINSDRRGQNITVGPHGTVKETTKNGERLTSLCVNNGLKTGNTFFQHTDIHKKNLQQLLLATEQALTESVGYQTEHGTLSMTGRRQRRTRNILDCDQSNYSSRIILAHIPAKLLS